MNTQSGWEQLLCDFFYAVCIRVLGPYFSSLGFVEKKSDINGVLFRRNDLFVEISYVPESAPNYSPSLIVGLGNYKYDAVGNTTGLPAWSILPDDGQSRNYSFWKFSDEKELESVLSRMKVEVIEQHMKPLWEDRVKLEDAIKNFD